MKSLPQSEFEFYWPRHVTFISVFNLSSVISGQGCEKEVTEASDGISDEQKVERIMRLSWALVHSRQPDDVQRGIAMLEGVIKFIQCQNRMFTFSNYF